MPKVAKQESFEQFRRPIKVGFDLDGVLLYNPVRAYRPVISFIKKRILKRKKTRFFVPTSPLQKLLFTLLHKSSVFIAPGFERIKQLRDAGIIEPYLVTARFSFLKNDLQEWLKKMDADSVFVESYANTDDEQPHLFKARKIQELGLDMFVEDNWDIVERVNRIVRPKKPDFMCWWVSNIMDSGIPYPHKVLSLDEAIDGIGFGMAGKSQTKVLVASDFFYPHWTGIAQSFLHFFSAVEDEFSIQVQTIKHQTILPRCGQINRLPVWRSRPLLGVSRAQISVEYIYSVWRSSKLADVLVINSPSAHILPLALIAFLRRIRLVVFHNGDLLLPKGFLNRAMEFVFDLSTHLACKVAGTVATYTQDYAEHSRILSKYLEKTVATGIPLVAAVEHPAVLPLEPEKTKAQQQLLQLKIDEIQRLKTKNTQVVLIGFAGRFVEEKGFDILFRAIPAVVKRFPQAIFAFAGETKMGYEGFFEGNAELYRSVKSQVRLLGLLDEKALSAFYDELDLFVLPSRSDCFALVQAEAALHGVPLVVADIPGARDLVMQTGAGLLFASQNSEDLSKKIIEAVERQHEFQSKRDSVALYFDYEKRRKTFAQLLSE